MATLNSLPEWPTNCYTQKICVLACQPPLRIESLKKYSAITIRKQSFGANFLCVVLRPKRASLAGETCVCLTGKTCTLKRVN